MNTKQASNTHVNVIHIERKLITRDNNIVEIMDFEK